MSLGLPQPRLDKGAVLASVYRLLRQRAPLYGLSRVAKQENQIRLLMLAWRFLGESGEGPTGGTTWEHGASDYIDDQLHRLEDLTKCSLAFLAFVAQDLKDEAHIRQSVR